MGGGDGPSFAKALSLRLDGELQRSRVDRCPGTAGIQGYEAAAKSLARATYSGVVGPVLAELLGESQGLGSELGWAHALDGTAFMALVMISASSRVDLAFVSLR